MLRTKHLALVASTVLLLGAAGCATGIEPETDSSFGAPGSEAAAAGTGTPAGTKSARDLIAFEDAHVALSRAVNDEGWARVDVGQHATLRRLPVTDLPVAHHDKLARLLAAVKAHRTEVVVPADDFRCKTTVSARFFDRTGTPIAQLDTSDTCGRIQIEGATYGVAGKLSDAVGNIAAEPLLMADVLYGIEKWIGEEAAETPIVTRDNVRTLFSFDEPVRVMWETDLPDTRPVGSFDIRRKDRSSVHFEVLGHAGAGGYIARVEQRNHAGANMGVGYVDYRLLDTFR